MTPTTQEHIADPKSNEMVSPADGNRIVISGMSGLYPQSRHLKEFEKILYNKINPITTENMRWNYDHPEMVQYSGFISELDRFDAQFFKVHNRQGNNMDPLGRKLLEQAYAAIYDAGVSPDVLNGKKVGVFIGSSLSETEKTCMYNHRLKKGVVLTGISKALFANRISYWLNTKGPSLNIDEICCSSTVALEQAFQAIARGECEAAIVGGANICMHPQSVVHIGRVMSLTRDGKTRSFDQNASGTVFSEAINVIFLQKAKDALRIYAEVVDVKCSFNSVIKEESSMELGLCNNSKHISTFLSDFYKKAGISPNLVEYVEAFGAADLKVDKAELEAFEEIFCKNRTSPLFVGSVMSNIGYSSAASGIAGITKVLLGYNQGQLAGNLHYDTPRTDVAGLCEGRIHILNDHQDFQRTYTAVNSLSISGVQGHVLMHGYSKLKNFNRYKTDIPRLVNISGRQEAAVLKIFDELKSKSIDPEQIALLHNLHETKISRHFSRGYIILDEDNEQHVISLSEKCNDDYTDRKRPLWFVYSGMGSQWPGMGKELMRLPVFEAAIKRCESVLKPVGIDIVHIITSTDNSIFDNILNSFVGIAAIQIGLTDVLKELGLVPDNIIGHSLGELGCAYADGCLTAEEMIMSSYSRGSSSITTSFIRGTMAAVGAGFKKISSMCPPDIDIACHNGPDSCTISGPEEIMSNFIASLTAKGIFVKEVPCSNIPFHSRYIADAGPSLLNYLKKIIKDQRPRSERWISTSVPKDRWNEPRAKYSSAEYFTDNLLNPVLFEEAIQLIPSDAVLIEIAPHGLLQAILKRSLPDSCTNIPLTRRGHPDNLVMLLEAVGSLFMEGFNTKVQLLYPRVEFPVSIGTQMLSHFTEWKHDEKWYYPAHASAERKKAAACNYVISVFDDDYSYLIGHVINKQTILPFSFALVAVWDTFAMSINAQKKETSVVFEDIQLFEQPILYKHGNNMLSVCINQGSGLFEVMNEYSRVATGYIKLSKKGNKKGLLDGFSSTQETYRLNSENVYELFSEINYAYNGQFQSIINVNDIFTEANLVWNDNWVTTIDGIFQLNILKQRHNSMSQPAHIGRLTIDVTDHSKLITSKNQISSIKTCMDDIQNFTRCGGVVIENIKFRDIQPPKDVFITLKSLKFVPRFNFELDRLSTFEVFIQIVAENTNKTMINVIALTNNTTEEGIFLEMKTICHKNISGINLKYQCLHEYTKDSLNDADLVVVQNISNDNNISQMLNSIKRIVFVINERSVEDMSRNLSNTYSVVSFLRGNNQNTILELARKIPIHKTTNKCRSMHTIRSESDLSLLNKTRNNLVSEDSMIILTSYPPVEGLIEIVKKWRSEDSQNNIYLYMADKIEHLEELPNDGLVFNVLYEGVWGGEYYLPTHENLVEDDKVMFQSINIGNFDSTLQLIQENKEINKENIIQVHYASINANDVKKAVGITSFENLDSSYGKGYGMEFSGLTKSGDRVMGLVPNGAASSHVIAYPELLWPVPSHWTLEDAATVPFSYVYAYYCLYIKTPVRLIEKDIIQWSVLVHGAAGALGQAIISIALANGFKVFATVSDIHKKRFLKKLFPELQEENIGNSRDISFGAMIMTATGGKGCNIVFCCLKGELKDISLQCCGSSGTTFDTALINNNENYQFGMDNLNKERAYVLVDFSSIFTHIHSEDMKKIQMLVSDGIALGHVRPLTRMTYSPHEAAHAFRLLATSQERGRVLLKMQEAEPLIQKGIKHTGDESHLILCDTTRLGLHLAETLINRGANEIYLHIPETSTYLRYKLSLWEKLNVKVFVSNECLNNVRDYFNLVQKASKSAFLSGVYIITNNLSQNNTISNLDLITRELSPYLRSFVVLSDNGSTGKYTCVVRVKDGFPATLLDLTTIKHFFSNDATWYRKAIEAVVLAQRIADPVLQPQVRRLPKISLLNQIAALSDIIISDQISSNTTLEQLGIDTVKSTIVSALLSSKYHISLCDDNISSLTIHQINEIDKRSQEPEPKATTGLQKFYTYVDQDEIWATTELVLKPTRTHNSSMCDDNFEASETFLCIIPGLEGHHAQFETLCERLKLPAFVIQPGMDYPEETPQELARRYAKILMRKTGLRDNFNILGYECGVIVALELASILENYGKIGTVFILGDGPEEMKALLLLELSAFESEEDLQAGVARHMFHMMQSALAPPAVSVLHDCTSWSERVTTCVRMLLGHVSHSTQYTRGILDTAYARICQVRSYSAAPRALRSRLVLLRAKSDIHIGNESSLQRYCLSDLIVQDLALPIPDVVIDPQVPALINRYLEKKILEEYENKNHCESYLTNTEVYQTSTME